MLGVGGCERMVGWTVHSVLRPCPLHELWRNSMSPICYNSKPLPIPHRSGSRAGALAVHIDGCDPYAHFTRIWFSRRSVSSTRICPTSDR